MIRTATVALLMASAVACSPATAAPATPTTAATAPGQPVYAATATGCHIVDGRADTRCTPGARNPQVTQLNIASTICKSGWTATVRPPASYTDALKVKQMRAYGETGPVSGYEEDHLIPLEAGGNPTDPANLWPEPRSGARAASVKDAAENAVKRAVCNGRLTLAEGQAQILRDWTH